MAAGTYTVRVTDSKGCTKTATAVIGTVTLAAPGPISGPVSNLCNANGKNYSITAVPGATSYTWTVPAGACITSNQGTSITVTFGGGFSVSGNVCVRANNACGTSAQTCLAVYSAPAQPGVISGSASVCKSQTCVYYSISSVPGATSYNWTISGGATFVGNCTGTTVAVRFTSATSTSATITVKANNSCGSSPVSSRTISVNLNCRTADGSGYETDEQFIAFPNPASDKVNVSFVAKEKGTYLFNLTDVIGNVIFTESYSATEGNNVKEFNLDGISKGIYL